MADVLIASDDETVVAELRGAIEGPDLHVRAVRSGEAVAPAVAAQAPDLVILDLQIGNMGGMAVCVHLGLEAGAGRLASMPVLMLLDRRPDVFLARRAGADGWLLKPIDPLRARRAVLALLDGDRFEDSTGTPPSVPGAMVVG